MRARQSRGKIGLPALSLLVLGVLFAATVVSERTVPEITVVAEQDSIIRSWEYVDGFRGKIAVFQTVFWEPRDTNSLRERIETTGLVRGKTVLEIGTGSGLVSLCCLRAGASKVVATDVNRYAVENARYNANVLGVADRLDVRLVPLGSAGAFTVIDLDEKFDVIMSNPPWEDDTPKSIDEFALYDRNFELLRSILASAKSHLNPGGRLLLAYGCREAIQMIDRMAAEADLVAERHDDRELSELPEVFVPGMLVEIRPRAGSF